MGLQTGDQRQLFYLFNLEERIPARHLLRRINPIVTRVFADVREKLKPFYSEIGRPSIDPELMLRMLIVGYCYGTRFERKLCEDVELHLAYRWFCRLDLADQIMARGKAIDQALADVRYTDLMRELVALADPVDRFFKDVMVMVDDKVLRETRLALLLRLKTQILRFADPSELVADDK